MKGLFRRSHTSLACVNVAAFAVVVISATFVPVALHEAHGVDVEKDCLVCKLAHQPWDQFCSVLHLRPADTCDVATPAERLTCLAALHASQAPTRAPPA